MQGFLRLPTGPITIDECSPDGRFIQLANTSKDKHADLSSWYLIRKVDAQDGIIYRFPSEFTLYRGQTVRIFTRSSQNERTGNDLVNLEADSWGLGLYIITRLISDNDEERATHIQSTAYPTSR
ncbi:unnamed protein product [Didymodactylos carnosus]|uniref:LTD domain-containing protein n=1 Tax=Didymodactylos carnosus TaxID=1234261 RepID=A0A816AGQ7_9BILA|nr:unnamed protein product [Didymodactylos carnosus]CAF1595380.1 unnamed protein product [Didymodactylos carnosus]CAF4293500.1 unnamed protein product [Didymodactylos carnosus]CAF4469849.1 unnamed protein product [Didymodactylos carnosus]